MRLTSLFALALELKQAGDALAMALGVLAQDAA